MGQSQTSFAQLFGNQSSGLPVVERIEIPLIQRDYAQGRKSENVDRIRANFLDALFASVMSDGKAISLDFVYGDVKNGTFNPLDGQQRLTTLFLLHWYLAWRAGVQTINQPWTNFTYATRPGARLFCESLAKYQPPSGEDGISSWLANQPWYLYTWQHDPTIQSMLVMLDALHKYFHQLSSSECCAAWNRLTDANHPAISFHLLPMEANGLTDDVYIKMNSRGKPLTVFENFKAHFEQVLRVSHQDRVDNFAKKVDTEWTDTLWIYRGDDNLIDDEFMRYFHFVTEVSAWKDGIETKAPIEILADRIYGADNANADTNLDFLFQAFDIWHKLNIKSEFETIFSTVPSATSLILFNGFKNVPDDISPIDLFAGCCRQYGKSEWTLAHTLLLYAVLLHRIHDDRESFICFPKQLRILRNLIEASSGGEIREQEMRNLLAEVKSIVVDCNLQSVKSFNQAQVGNENDKSLLLAQNPELQSTLHQLEDHVLLRGCLSAFDLVPSESPKLTSQRATAFHVIFTNPSCWLELTGALLAIGDYSRTQGQRFSDFGAHKNTEPWRDLLTGAREPKVVMVLMSLLDQIAAANNDLAYLHTIQERFLDQCVSSKTMDWRYYFVKYPAMREGQSGRYVGLVNKSGYSVCMLNKTVMRSYYRDPYLLAIWRKSGVGKAVDDPWFYGYESEFRWMFLKKSGVKVQCLDQGLQITAPPDNDYKNLYDQVLEKYGIGSEGLFEVQQNSGIDTNDRVTLCANLLIDLVNKGL
ncbi:DUF262 domain-containing protein [Methylotenera sp.]|uniref:DUF262 domain-containing protein n=1 Tax=Methylotenera sp. TaxID=2051956 RepID=UPI002735C65E|nr:DUF262 domain-containing protein [Methylotenera sp.]MDP3212029.1 DUF262 domain-containing protein [Methylotenera sp.]